MESPPEPTMKKNNKKPLEIRLIESTKKSGLSFRTYQAIVLIVTFFAYTSYHANRKTMSIVKQALDPQSLSIGPNLQWQGNSTPKSFRDGWFPFDGPDGTAMLGDVDVAFLFVYAIGMYFSGHVGDRMDLRVFLTAGMLGTGLFTALFGIGYWANIHSFYYYLIVQMIAGLFQSTGWPSVVAVVGNWFGKKKRGLIMGIWNAHTSVGNIRLILANTSSKLEGGFSIPLKVVNSDTVVIYQSPGQKALNLLIISVFPHPILD